MAAQFCRCGHNRSFYLQGMPHICREPSCECVKHDTAVTPKKAKLKAVEPWTGHAQADAYHAGLSEGFKRAGETPAKCGYCDAEVVPMWGPCPNGCDGKQVVKPSPNAMARDAAVALLRNALMRMSGGYVSAPKDNIAAAIVCLEAIS